jgi:hypothetical protein
MFSADFIFLEQFVRDDAEALFEGPFGERFGLEGKERPAVGLASVGEAAGIGLQFGQLLPEL